MAMIARQGIRLAYEDQGVGKPAFIFVHGWACDRSAFAPQAAHFARRHRVVSVDLRGHGESDKPQGPYPILTHAEDLAYIIEHLALGKVVAVGHSMGGLTVLQLAAAYPDHVAAIVMVDPAPFVRPPELRARSEAMLAAMEAGDQEPQRQFIANMFLPISDRRLVEDVLAMMLAAPSHIAVSAMRGPRVRRSGGGGAVPGASAPSGGHAAAQSTASHDAVATDGGQWLDRGGGPLQSARGARPGERDD
jgi:pimeloyl-ACP methyl ester carboxylesterase